MDAERRARDLDGGSSDPVTPGDPANEAENGRSKADGRGGDLGAEERRDRCLDGFLAGPEGVERRGSSGSRAEGGAAGDGVNGRRHSGSSDHVGQKEETALKGDDASDGEETEMQGGGGGGGGYFDDDDIDFDVNDLEDVLV